jgi:predicted transcriptional regulator
MNSETTSTRNVMIELTADIVAAYVGNNSIAAGSLPELLSSVYSALNGVLAPPAPPEPEKLVPAVPVKKSVTPDYLISLEDGRRYKSLKRHLGGRGLTPDQYRAKWGLSPEYPMVAANYAKQRSELARSMGLGRKRTEPEPAAEPAKAVRRRKVG